MMLTIAVVLLLAVGVAAMAQEPATPEEKAISMVFDLQGNVRRDMSIPCRPVVSVDLGEQRFDDYFIACNVTDSDLKILKEFRDLRTLNLSGTPITDAGLRELTELKGLHWLNLAWTEVTGDGLKELEQRFPKTDIYRNGP